PLPTELDGGHAPSSAGNARAPFGLGVGADGSEICAIGLCFFRATESFVKPATCASQPPPNTAPTVTINSPAGGTLVPAGTTVSFAGTASRQQGARRQTV